MFYLYNLPKHRFLYLPCFFYLVQNVQLISKRIFCWHWLLKRYEKLILIIEKNKKSNKLNKWNEKKKWSLIVFNAYTNIHCVIILFFNYSYIYLIHVYLQQWPALSLVAPLQWRVQFQWAFYLFYSNHE